jgi:hypothetical protein
MFRPLGALATVVVLSLGGCDRKKDSKTKGPDIFSEVRTAVPAARVSASDLVKDYRKNEVGADLKYRGKIVAVSGPFMVVQKGAAPPGLAKARRAEEVVASLDPMEVREGGTVSMFVQCYLDADDAEQMRKTAELGKGSPISVIGKGAGVIGGDVALDGCRLQEVGGPERPRPPSSAEPPGQFSLGKVTGSDGDCAALMACCSTAEKPRIVDITCSGIPLGHGFPDCKGNLQAIGRLYKEAGQARPSVCDAK